ncbi:MAG: glycosyltransferase [Acaryochloris sp. RU_4_1]|nr:glycosyltransferase [Acaryochloris sp. RU_4_1]NJR57096.1 glycosyltransferase [Acaryochloris sp. CRU_2_0]
MFFSVIIPTYNRLPILQKCLHALSQQHLAATHTYEIVVVDDGSTDDTVAWLASQSLPYLSYIGSAHQGAAAARNLGLQMAQGDTVVFIDSDLVVTEQFLQAHAQALQQGRLKFGHDRLFTYGRVIQTYDFQNPTATPYKLSDYSAAYFATGNVAISRHWLDTVGGFDPNFRDYGWEDLELGLRLQKLSLILIKAPQAVGYHWHPPFSLEQLPHLIAQEQQRGRMGVQFYRKHPTTQVKLMIQMTPWHRLLWGLLTINGRLNEQTLLPPLRFLIQCDRPQLALGIARIFLNWYQVQSAYAAYNQPMQKKTLHP